MPRHVLTPTQIEQIPLLVVRYGDGQRLAREWGVSDGTISYHLRGGKANRVARQIAAEAMHAPLSVSARRA